MVSNPFSEGISVMIRGDASDFDDAIESSKRSLGKLGSKINLARGALAGLGAAGFAVAVNEARKFESAMADVEKVTSAKTAKNLKQQIMDLSEEIPIAAQDLAKLAEQAGKFGAEGEKEIMRFVETVGKIQTATDLTAQEAGTRFAKIAGAVGLPLSEVGKLGNATNKLADSMKTDANEITDTATRAANTLGQQLGLGEDAILALSASMNEVSPSAELAGSSLRRAAEALMNPKKVKDISKALGMSVGEFRKMRKTNPHGLMKEVAMTMNENGSAASRLRGRIGKAATDFSKLGTQLDRTKRGQKLVNEQFENGTSLQKEMEIRTNTLNGKLILLRNKLQNVARQLGQKLTPHVKTLIDWLIRGVQQFSKLNAKLDGVLAPAILLGPIIAYLGTVFSALIGAISIPALTAAAAGIAAVAGPAVIATAAIAGLFYAWKNNLFGIRNHTKKAVSFLQKWFGKAMKFLNKLKTIAIIAFNRARFEIIKFGMKAKQIWKRDIEPLVTSTVNTFNRIKKTILSALKFVQNNVIRPILNWIRKEWNDNGKRMVNQWVKTAKQLMKWARQIANFIQNKVLGPFINWATREWGKFTNFLNREIRKAWNAIRPFINGALDALERAFNGTIEFVSGAWREWGDELWETVKFAFDLIKGAVETGLDAIATTFSVVMKVLRLDFEGAWQSIKDFAKRTLEGITGFVDKWNIVGAIKSAFNSAGKAAGNALKGAFNAAMPNSVGIPSVTVAGQTFGGGSIRLPHLATGGFIEEGGLARLHAGEQVVPAADVAKRAPTGGGTVIKIENINASGRMEGRRAGMALVDELRSHGFNS